TRGSRRKRALSRGPFRSGSSSFYLSLRISRSPPSTSPSTSALLISAGLRAESNGRVGVQDRANAILGGAAAERQTNDIRLPCRNMERDVTEILIRKRVEDLAKAIGAKDIDRVMALYARDLVSFDLTPPLRRFGADEKRRAWQEAFAALSGP